MAREPFLSSSNFFLFACMNACYTAASLLQPRIQLWWEWLSQLLCSGTQTPIARDVNVLPVESTTSRTTAALWALNDGHWSRRLTFLCLAKVYTLPKTHTTPNRRKPATLNAPKRKHVALLFCDKEQECADAACALLSLHVHLVTRRTRRRNAYRRGGLIGGLAIQHLARCSHNASGIRLSGGGGGGIVALATVHVDRRSRYTDIAFFKNSCVTIYKEQAKVSLWSLWVLSVANGAVTAWSYQMTCFHVHNALSATWGRETVAYSYQQQHRKKEHFSLCEYKSHHTFLFLLWTHEPRQDLRTEPGDVPHRCCAAPHLVSSGTSSHGMLLNPRCSDTKKIVDLVDYVCLYKKYILLVWNK